MTEILAEGSTKRKLGRPFNPIVAGPHPNVLKQRARDALKLKHILEVIKEEFDRGGIRAFLQSWTTHEETSQSRDNFIRGGGAKEIMPLWLNLMGGSIPEELPTIVV